MPVRPLLLAVLALAVALPAAPAAAAAACAGADTNVSPAGLASAREAVLCLVNEERTSRGLNALEHDDLLTDAAQAHSADMVLRGFFDHVNPDGKDPGDRIEAAGYDWASYGENIAQGFGSPSAVMAAWMASPGHRANILSPQFTELGVGMSLVDGTWTQNFGRPRGVPAPDTGAGPGVAAGEPAVSAGPPPAPEAGPDAVLPAARSGGAAVPLTFAMRRVGRFLRVSGKLAAGRARVRVVQAGRTLARKRVRARGGRYRMWIAVPSGPLKVIVRGGGRRAVRGIA